MRLTTQLGFFAILAMVCATAYGAPRPPQFVHLAFDGSKNIGMWKETREFARKQGNVRFTYFISGVYFVPNSNKYSYVEPKKGSGKSAIGFGGKKSSISLRLKQVRAAHDEDHEIASHANGHYDGSSYSYNQWFAELDQFTNIMSSAWGRIGINSQRPSWWKPYMTNKMIGFRAPQLGKSKGLWRALVNTGYEYDTSKVDKMNYWPKKRNGIWNFPLAGLRVVGSGKRTLSMDYNFYVAQSKAKPAASRNLIRFENEVYNTYMAYFNKNYYGNRAPIDIGHHFSKWNKGIYWDAFKRFAKTVCGKKEVVCATYAELVDFLNQKSISEVDDYQKGNFTMMPKPTSGIREGSILLEFTARPQNISELTDKELNELRVHGGDHAAAHE